MNDTQRAATDMVLILHRSMDWDIWGKKRLKYWDTYQEAVAACAYTNSLAAWLNSVCLQMSIVTPGRNDTDRAHLEGILNSNQDDRLLDCLRFETVRVFLAARVAIEQTKEARSA